MIKGYIFKDRDRWHLGFLSHLDKEGEALFITHGDYSTHEEAVKALVTKQIEEQ